MQTAVRKLNARFLCTGNSRRSRMAGGWASHLQGRRDQSLFGWFEKDELNPYAVQVMDGAGVDIAKQHARRKTE